MKLWRECHGDKDCYSGACEACGGLGQVEVEAVVVPWCAVHNQRWIDTPGACIAWLATEDADIGDDDIRCRLEEPAQVYRIDT